MSRNPSDLEDVRALLPLRVSNDLTPEEIGRVDERARANPNCQAELEKYTRIYEMLREVGAEPLPVDGRRSLWDRIEPQLRNRSQMRKRPWYWLSTPQLAAGVAAMLLIAVSPQLKREFSAMNGGSGAPVVTIEGADATPIAGPDGRVRPLRPSRPRLGLIVQNVDSRLRERLGRPELQGAMVVQIMSGMPGDRADIKQDDVIVGVNDRAVHSAQDLVDALEQFKPGEEVRLEVLHGSQVRSVQVRLGGAEQSKAHDAFPSPAFAGQGWPQTDGVL